MAAALLCPIVARNTALRGACFDSALAPTTAAKKPGKLLGCATLAQALSDLKLMIKRRISTDSIH